MKGGMAGWFETIARLEGNDALVRKRAYGLIETRRGQLARIQFRPFPKWGSLLEIGWSSGWGKSRRDPDCCRLYYSQPWGSPNYLTLNYMVSTVGTTMQTLVKSLEILDGVAAIKRSDALLCEVSNGRISDRMLRRYGWERQEVAGSRRRHWIKRFYGAYPSLTATACSESATETGPARR